MKEKFLTKSLSLVKEYNPSYDEEKMAIIKYGIEGMYLTITKLIIVLTLAIVLNIFKECILLLVIYSIIRSVSFGFHASNSWSCLISSILIFIGIPYIGKFLIIPSIVKIIISIICCLIFLKYAPADTRKRPILPGKRKNIFKFLSLVTAIIYSILALSINNEYISFLLIGALIFQAFTISPIPYYFSKQPYNNWKTYQKQV